MLPDLARHKFNRSGGLLVLTGLVATGSATRTIPSERSAALHDGSGTLASGETPNRRPLGSGVGALGAGEAAAKPGGKYDPRWSRARRAGVMAS